jgi:hypothetical protein
MKKHPNVCNNAGFLLEIYLHYLFKITVPGYIYIYIYQPLSECEIIYDFNIPIVEYMCKFE